MEKIKAIIEITRWPNCIMAGFAVIVGAFASGFYYDPKIFNLIIGFFAAFLTAASGNVINDVMDHEIDAINVPERVIPSGRLTRKVAVIESIILMIIGVMIVFFTLNIYSIIIITIGSTLIILYSTKLKRMGFIGNITIGILTSFCLLLGGAGQYRLDIAFWPALIAFVMNIGREITKGIDDIVGDKAENVKTIPVLIGAKKSAYIVVVIMIVTLILSPIPYLIHYFNLIYLLITLIIVDSMIVCSIISILKDSSSKNCHKLKKIQKLAMFIGLISFLLGSIILPT
ncbi:MAG: geranylgeranylglycerol-phosphate geranylgeranyltransferase [Candidatus Helarchaeota archaeon]